MTNDNFRITSSIHNIRHFVDCISCFSISVSESTHVYIYVCIYKERKGGIAINIYICKQITLNTQRYFYLCCTIVFCTLGHRDCTESSTCTRRSLPYHIFHVGACSCIHTCMWYIYIYIC